MKNLKSYEISMRQGEFQHIRGNHNGKIMVACRKGLVWVTAAGDPNDYIVAAGDKIELTEGQADVLLQSMSDDLEVEILH